MENIKIISKNKKALHDYAIIEKKEAGIVLTGTEIKSIRNGRVNLKGSFVEMCSGEAVLTGCHIPEYQMGSFSNHDPMRRRKLLLHKKEIHQWLGKVTEKGYTVVPLSLYLSNGKAKVEIALCQGKKKWDKREDIAKKDADRRMKQALSPKNQLAG